MFKTGRKPAVPGYLVFELVRFGDQSAIAVNSKSNASSHLSVFENTLTGMQVFSKHLQCDLGIIESAFTLFALGGASKFGAVLELYLNDGIESERIQTMVYFLEQSHLEL